MDLHPFFVAFDSRVLRSISEEDRPKFLRDGVNPPRHWPVDASQFRHIRTDPRLDTRQGPDGSFFGWPHHEPQSDW